MAQTQTPAKPMFKAPEKGPPLKIGAVDVVHQSTVHVMAEELVGPGWQPLSTAPKDPAARFWVRVCVNGKPVGGTETLVRYRVSRARINKKWVPSLTIIDDKLGTKLGFRPSEWKPEEKADAGGN